MTTPSAQPSPSEPALPRPTRLPTRPAGGVTPSGTVTLTGTVSAGVEPNCLLLDGNLLVGGPRDVLKPGARVTVTGHSQPDLMTTCQQGTPFVVDTAKPA